MRKIEKIVEQREVERVVEETCDICGQPKERWTSDFQAAPNGFTDALLSGPPDTETTIKLGASYGYPEGGYGRTWQYDVCPTCMLTKLLPWIEAHRHQAPRIVDYDW